MGTRMVYRVEMEEFSIFRNEERSYSGGGIFHPMRISGLGGVSDQEILELFGKPKEELFKYDKENPWWIFSLHVARHGFQMLYDHPVTDENGEFSPEPNEDVWIELEVSRGDYKAPDVFRVGYYRNDEDRLVYRPHIRWSRDRTVLREITFEKDYALISEGPMSFDHAIF